MKINYIKYTLLLFTLFVSSHIYSQKQSIEIDADFPGGNIIVDGNSSKRSTSYYSITDTKKTIRLRPDLRDTKGDWFYWYFRIKGATGKKLNFQFPKRKIGAFGPAYSKDSGQSWEWLYDHPQENDSSFSYSFTNDENEVRFSMGMPYLQSNFEAFIKPYKNNPHLSISSLTTSAKGRNVEKLVIHNPEKPAKYKIVITARHHACEMMASYVLEGLIASILSDDENMRWLRDNVEFFIVPFMDKDGVEDGDQGKNRIPRDHWLDYAGQSIYKSTAALREQIPAWAEGKLKVAMDLHCPSLTGKGHEYIHLVGEPDKNIETEQVEFAKIIFRQHGELDFQADNILPFGTGWNIPSNYSNGLSFSSWMAKVDGLSFATTVEFPYSNANGQQITPQNARLFGQDVAKAIFQYLQNLKG